MHGYHLGQAIENGLQSQREFALTRPDAAAGDIDELLARLIEQPEAGDA